MKIGISYGSATLLGFNSAKCLAPPETVYMIIGGRCAASCSFCSRGSENQNSRLSRVSWPEYEKEEAFKRIAAAYEDGKIKRICFQTVLGRGIADELAESIKAIKKICGAEISTSVSSSSIETLDKIFAAGADRISLPIDCASKKLFKQIKKRDMDEALLFLKKAAKRYPGKITTHIIAGLGETEEEIINFLEDMHKCGITTGLFAFTPVPHSEMADCRPPDLSTYREIQLAHYLIKNNCRNLFTFKEGIILFAENLYKLLKSEHNIGEIFRTTGCPGCNRPYYNERPGAVPYNYPYIPDEREAEQAIMAALSNSVGTKINE